jgi:(E)-4-hydroxy-3-methylbut-2-enyl-diphosphate synthase
VGHVQVGGGAPIVVQSMTMTDTADARATAVQCVELASAGSDMVRVTVNNADAAAAVPEIKQRMLDAGCTAPLIGDFHYNGHLLLTKFPDCAEALDKYRINPGNVGTGKRRDEQFAMICQVAVDRQRPVRIRANGGSLNQELVVARMQENTDRHLGKTSEEIINEGMVLSAIESTELALECGLRDATRSSSVQDLAPARSDRRLSRALDETDQPLHLGLTEAGMARRAWSPRRRWALQRGHRRHHPRSLTRGRAAIGVKRSTPPASCCIARTARVLAERHRVSGCGRTTSSTFQARRTDPGLIRDQMPHWKTRYDGVEP